MGGRCFPAANTFPKSRETRAPLVEELYRFRDRLPEKLRYLADAPQQDPDGNKTLVRFSRKTSSSTWRQKKRVKRPVGQPSILTVNGLKPRSKQYSEGPRCGPFVTDFPALFAIPVRRTIAL
jgi:hypothetical protein